MKIDEDLDTKDYFLVFFLIINVKCLVRHESSPLMNPVDIHGYQPPWKALSEFAMQPDIERLDPGHPNFHHIMQQVIIFLFKPFIILKIK